MHRSATSFAAGVLHRGGISFGDRMQAETHGNRTGHFENLDFQEFHINTLRLAGLSEHGWVLNELNPVSEELRADALKIISESTREPAWGWKDPRTTLFLSFWQSVLPHARYVFLYRPCWEVVDSLYRRNGPADQIFAKKPELAVELWIHYNRLLLEFFDAHSGNCVLICANSLVASPLAYIDLISKRFDVAIEHQASELYEESSFRSDVSHFASLIRDSYPLVDDIWEKLEGRSSLPMSSSEIASTPDSKTSAIPHKELNDWLAWRRPGEEAKHEGPSRDSLKKAQAKLEQELNWHQSKELELQEELSWHKAKNEELLRDIAFLKDTVEVENSKLQSENEELREGMAWFKTNQEELQKSLDWHKEKYNELLEERKILQSANQSNARR